MMRCTFLPLKARHMTKKVHFKIEHMDPLGQGVSKITDKIVFIPGTLPGEEGEAEILKESKGVAFAKVTSLTKSSPQRITPECPHFEECNGCHYLHTDYTSELEFKKKSLIKDFQKFEALPEVEVLKAPSRLNYRNRVQLHYHKKAKLIGFHQYKSNRIAKTDDCKIFEPQLQECFDETLQNFQKLLASGPVKGHVEIYLKDGKVQRSFNKSYSEGGFSQVNAPMNHKAVELIQEELQKISSNHLILDLFGGSGNLTQGQTSPSIVVDAYPADKTSGNQRFLNLDLFSEQSLDQLLQEIGEENVSQMVIDPPRSGFKLLVDYVEAFGPEKIIYMSCKPSTMARDLAPIKNQFDFKKFMLLDFFPSTFHYEALAVLERKAN